MSHRLAWRLNGDSCEVQVLALVNLYAVCVFRLRLMSLYTIPHHNAYPPERLRQIHSVACKSTLTQDMQV